MKNTKDYYNRTASEWADKWYQDESLLPYLKELVVTSQMRYRHKTKVFSICK